MSAAVWECYGKIHFLRWLLHRPDEMADRRFQPLNSVYHTLQAALAVPEHTAVQS